MVAGPWMDSVSEPVSRTMIGVIVLIVIGLLTTGWRQAVGTTALALLLALAVAGLVGGPLVLSGALGLAVAGVRKGRLAAFA